MCTGDTTEDVLVQLIIKQSQGSAWSLAGKLTLSELIALIDVASLLISNNTGPAHIASAVGTPVVVLYALTNPQHTPWHVPSSVLYFPVSETFKDIIVSSAIPQNALPLESPKQVVDQALRLLQKTRNTLSPYDEKRISSYTNI